MTTISMASALAVGRAELATPRTAPRGTPDLHLGDLAALLAFCRIQIALHARNAPYEARALLEGGPGEDGAECLTIAAYQRVTDACTLWEQEEAA